MTDRELLELAVARKMQIDIMHSRVRVLADGGSTVYEDSDGDMGAATRRAIVRAAAEIGKEPT